MLVAFSNISFLKSTLPGSGVIKLMRWKVQKRSGPYIHKTTCPGRPLNLTSLVEDAQQGFHTPLVKKIVYAHFQEFGVTICGLDLASYKKCLVFSGRIRDLILGRRCTQHYTCNALSGHSLSLLLGGGASQPNVLAMATDCSTTCQQG